MRIIAGSLGGRLFVSPKSNRTHPMSEKARGGLFSALGDISDLTVLDAFAGSGALSFEALSRGAASVVAIDLDREAIKAMTTSAEQLGIKGKIKIQQKNIVSWLATHPSDAFDIILVDPPYDHLNAEYLEQLTNHLKPQGLYVLSWPGKATAPTLPKLAQLNVKSYGDAQLVFYRRIS